MTDDIRQAFTHPAERAAATAPDGALRDRISVSDYVLEVEIGAFQAERGVRQRVRFNVVVEVAGADAAAATDDVDMVLSYDRVTEAIDAVLSEERLNLLETLAERVAERILAEPLATRVFVRIEKIDRGPFALGVEIVRGRDGDTAAATEMQDTPHPRIVHLSNAALAAEGLPALLDRLTDVPVILTVGPADVPALRSAAPLAQRRIDLLAIEQNAWVLAGRDRRCIVVGSRTELDWALRHGQVSVWAPSKIVLDTVEGPPTGTGEGDPLALVAWFAGLMGAAELVVVGEAAPATEVPTREEPLP